MFIIESIAVKMSQFLNNNHYAKAKVYANFGVMPLPFSTSQLNKEPDEVLVSRVQNGDQAAFQCLYERYWKKLYQYSCNILRDEVLCEDVLQEVFINFWNKRQEVSISNLNAYLITSVKNRSINSLKKITFTELHNDIISGLSVAPDATENLYEEALRKTIMDSIKVLPKRCREIFVLSRFEHMSIDEIATKYNISKRTVENQLHIALKHLRNNLDENSVTFGLFVAAMFLQG